MLRKLLNLTLNRPKTSGQKEPTAIPEFSTRLDLKELLARLTPDNIPGDTYEQLLALSGYDLTTYSDNFQSSEELSIFKRVAFNLFQSRVTNSLKGITEPSRYQRQVIELTDHRSRRIPLVPAASQALIKQLMNQCEKGEPEICDTESPFAVYITHDDEPTPLNVTVTPINLAILTASNGATYHPYLREVEYPVQCNISSGHTLGRDIQKDEKFLELVYFCNQPIVSQGEV